MPNPSRLNSSASQPEKHDHPQAGFTLIELMIVMAIIALLAAIAVPSYKQSIRHANEAVLKADLHAMREAIDAYTVDKEKGPQSLQEVVDAGYLRSMPVDPVTHRSDTWQPHMGDMLTSIDQTEPGIDDVHSGSQELATDGSTYNTW